MLIEDVTQHDNNYKGVLEGSLSRTARQECSFNVIFGFHLGQNEPR